MASLRVLIVPDKFKGTLTAAEAAEAMAAGWHRRRPSDRLELLPMSDGGDGFGDIHRRLLGAQEQTCATVDAAHRPCQAVWWWHPSSRTAVVESAKVIGLAMLPPGRFHPFDLDTFGLGAVLEQAAALGARRCLVGIGGSATNDGGFGLARALGWRLLDGHGQALHRWTELDQLVRMEPPLQPRLFDELRVAVDVQNPLLGPEGCARVFGPQKGLRPEDFSRAESCLGRLAAVACSQFGRDFAAEAGAGAAGGLGFGLLCFAGAALAPGFELFAQCAHLAERVQGSDLVLTGEGAIDRSSLMGKGVGELARLCRRLGVPCVALGGVASEESAVRGEFAAVRTLAPELASPAEALSRAAHWLEALADRVAASWPPAGAR